MSTDAVKTTLCNMALGFLGGATGSVARIDTYTEATEAAAWCRVYFDIACSETYRKWHWSEARAIEALTSQQASDIPGWTYSYALPTGCISFIAVCDPENAKIRYRHDLIGGKVYTNCEEAYCEYVGFIEADAQSSTLAIAIAHRLAYWLAMPICGPDRGRAERADALMAWESALHAAKQDNQREHEDSGGEGDATWNEQARAEHDIGYYE